VKGGSCGIPHVFGIRRRKRSSWLLFDRNERPGLVPADGVRDDDGDVRQHDGAHDEDPPGPTLHHDRERQARDADAHDEQVSALPGVHVVTVRRSGRGDGLDRLVPPLRGRAHTFTVPVSAARTGS